MTRVIRLLTIAALGASLGGCVAAAVPIAASSAIVKKRMDARSETQAQQPAGPPRAQPPIPAATWQRMDDLTAMPPPSGTAPATPFSQPRGTVPAGMQYLYGSGEAAAISAQAYGALTRYLRAQIAAANVGELRQVVLADGASLDAPRFEPCGKKPVAVVLDIDETAILNLGYEGDEARRGGSYDEARWLRWEQTGATRTVAVPGAVPAITAARKAGITVIFNSNRSRKNAQATAEAIERAGLGPVKHGTTLWLKGDDGGGSAKDNRRWAIAAGYCVIALVGDQLGDFSDLFSAATLTPSMRRALSGAPEIARLWGSGWFLLPNPVYGTALKGGFDDIFPLDMRWTDPGEGPGSVPDGAAPTPLPKKDD